MIGILLKDNTLYWDKSISGDMEIRGITSLNDKFLQKGELVLLDSDFVYSESDYLEKMSRMILKEESEFEKRYISEKGQNGLGNKKD